MTLDRRTLLAGSAALAASTAFAAPARAQNFPQRPVTIVVPYPAGGAVDAVARILAQEAAADLGGSLVVDNRGGGSGTIGTGAVARAEADGHTLVLGTNQTHATNQSLLKSTPYDAERDFAPVIGIARIPHVLVVRKDLPANDVQALVALSKTGAGLNYGSTGVGSASHLAAELFRTRTGANMVHVPFRGGAPLLTELLGGRIDLSFATLPTVIAQVENGDLRVLGTASGSRAAKLPNVPTLAEAGVTEVEADAWFALFAPKATPQPIVAKLHAAFAAALGKANVRDALARQGMEVRVQNPAELSAALPAEIARWAAVIKAANISAD